MKTEKKSGAARTQLAVTDETWSDERVKGYLYLQPVAGESADYHVLVKAYRGMVPETFVRFVAFYVEAGRDLNAPGPGGKTMLKVMSEHRKSTEYAQIMREAGAK